MPWRRFSIFHFSPSHKTHAHKLHINTAPGWRMGWDSKHESLFQKGCSNKTQKLFYTTVSPPEFFNLLLFYFFFYLWLQSGLLFFFLARSDSRSCSGCHSLATSCQEDLQYFNMGHWATPLKYKWEVEFDWSGFLITFWWTTYIVLPKSLVFTVLPDYYWQGQKHLKERLSNVATRKRSVTSRLMEMWQ